MIKVLIVDDEPAMLAVMKRKLERMANVKIVGSYRQAGPALEALTREQVDLAFVDIMIAGDNGLELARCMREIDNRLELVFVTSHKEFAIDSFDTYPLDYMVKPVSQIRLEQTINRAAARKAAAQQEGDNAAEEDKLVVHGLGGLEAGKAKSGPVRWISRKSQEMFAYLLLHRGREAPRSRIIEDVFSDMPVENAHRYLNTAIYQLRQALKPYIRQDAVSSSREEYSLAMDAVKADFIEFESYVSRRAEWDDSNIHEALERERAYAGELYEGKSYLWAVGERARLEELYESFAKRLIRWLLERQRSEEALPIAHKLAHRQELDEEANLLLLRVYREIGDWPALQKHYAGFSERYRVEVGLSPSSYFMDGYKELAEGWEIGS